LQREKKKDIPKMIRRDPTRIEFTMDDVEVYKMRRENAKAATSGGGGASNKSNNTGGGSAAAAAQASQADAAASSKSDAIRERIGFDPTPRSS